MKKIFLGFLLIMLQFKVQYFGDISLGYYGRFVIDFFPTFIGYILLMQGLKSMSREKAGFQNIIPAAMVMAVLTGIEFFFNAFGLFSAIRASLILRIFELIYQLFTLIMMFVISYQVVKAVHNMEKNHSANFNGKGLKNAWVGTIVINIILLVPSILLYYAHTNLLVIIFVMWIMIGGLTANIWFLVSLYHSQKRYAHFKLQRKRQIQKRYAELSAAAEQNEKNKELDIDLSRNYE